MLNYMLLLGVVMVIGILLEKVVAKLPIPSLLIFISVGILFGEDGIVGIKFNNYNFAKILCSVGLIFIMFYGGFQTKIMDVKNILVSSALLSSVGVCLTALLSMCCCYFFLDISLKEGLLIGSILSSTDASSVFHVLKSQNLKLKNNTDSLLEVESGSNDPAAYLLTTVSIALLLDGNIDILNIVVNQLIFGVLVGLILGVIGIYIIRRFSFSENSEKSVIVLSIAILSYALSEKFGGNGYLSTYICGIYMGNKKISKKSYLLDFFDTITGIAQLMIFFVLGLLAAPSLLPNVIAPSIIIMVFLTFVARPISVYILLRPRGVSLNEIIVISFAGLKGAASVCFAIYAMLSTYDGTYMLYNIVLFVVVLSLSFQGSLLPYVCRLCNMIDKNRIANKTLNDYKENSEVNFIKLKIRKGHKFIDKKIKDLNVPHDLLVSLIIRKNKPFIPNGDTIIKEEDLLVVAGREFEEENDIVFLEKEITKRDRWLGKSLDEIKLPKGNLVVMIKKEQADIIPSGNTILEKGDALILARSSATSL